MEFCNILANSDGSCKKCGESGLFTAEMKMEHAKLSPECADWFSGKKMRQLPGALEVISARSLCSMEFPKEDWLVQGLMPVKGVVFLGGKRGSMKTWAALDMALAIARGSKFLGHFQAAKKDVIFLDSENGQAQLQKRLKMLGDAAEIPENLHFVFFPAIKLEEDASPLEDVLQEHEGAVVIIDSFRRVLGVDENDAGAVNALFVHSIRPLIEAYGTTFILLHHLRKGIGRGIVDHLDELRGSSEMVNYADAVLLMERVRGDGKTIILRHPKNRTGIEQAPSRIEICADEESFALKFIGAFEDEQSQPQLAADSILKWAFASGKSEFKTADAQDALQMEFNKKAISRGLKWLLDEGKISKRKKGEYALAPKKLADYGTPDTPYKAAPPVPCACEDREDELEVAEHTTLRVEGEADNEEESTDAHETDETN